MEEKTGEEGNTSILHYISFSLKCPSHDRHYITNRKDQGDESVASRKQR